MRMLCCLALLAAPALAQETEKAPPASNVAGQAENVFYKAYYLNRGARRYADALELYQKFLKAAPDHRYARRAAEDVIAILNRTDKRDQAQEMRTKYASILGRETRGEGDRPIGRAAERPAGGTGNRPDRGQRGGERGQRGGERGQRGGERGSRGGERGSRGGGGRELTAEEKDMLQQRKKGLEADLAAAKTKQDERTVARLERQIERLKGQLEAGVRPEGRGGMGGRGGQRGGGQRGGQRGRGGRGGFGAPNFAEMTKDEINQRLERFEGFMDRILDRMDKARADEFEKKWKAMKKLVDEDKKEEAQKAYDEVMQLMRRR